MWMWVVWDVGSGAGGLAGEGGERCGAGLWSGAGAAGTPRLRGVAAEGPAVCTEAFWLPWSPGIPKRLDKHKWLSNINYCIVVRLVIAGGAAGRRP